MSAAVQLALFGEQSTSPREASRMFATYPTAPGFKQRGGPSQEAARKIAPRITGLRAKVLAEVIQAAGTADEIADRLGLREFSVRPRITELHALGKVTPTGLRRANRSGMTATVWQAVTP